MIWKGFKEGYRILMLLHRKKDGGPNNTDHKSKRFITKNEKEFNERFDELVEELRKSDLPLRIYCSVNDRDFQKAVRSFKIKQIEIECHSEERQVEFYQNMNNNFISCLAQPKCARSKYFLIDVDFPGDDFYLINKKLKQNTEIIRTMPTQNGVHIITKPFNPALVPEAEIKKDAMLLLGWKGII